MNRNLWFQLTCFGNTVSHIEKDYLVAGRARGGAHLIDRLITGSCNIVDHSPRLKPNPPG